MAILITVNVLNNVGKPEWAIPAVIFIIGAHFMPLAHLFRYFPHYVSGIALMAWAIAYPWLSVAGPASAIGSLGIGLILWVSAVYALTRKAE